MKTNLFLWEAVLQILLPVQRIFQNFELQVPQPVVKETPSLIHRLEVDLSGQYT